MASGKAIAEAITANAERVRRVVPAVYRAERTPVVYLLARYMYEGDSGLTDEQILTAFAVLAWAAEDELWAACCAPSSRRSAGKP